ncbi:hypothetical protein UFOVP435_35 [uncultured Caudovirales phage]|uniref:Uncharacterized protein n=1 Tax=uncultured Caudovirales phage TaxID=2100421 RepID=A0A6J5MGU0_9CAUD|nr:hypothetical protein UFOVP435_35 [uncultured Caudovirales phage]
MPTTSQPFGFRPAYHPSGRLAPNEMINALQPGAAVTLWRGQPFFLTGSGAAGASQISPVAATTDIVAGVFWGVEYTDVNGRRIYSTQWQSGTITGVPAGVADIRAYVFNDPDTIYEVQTSAPLSGTNVVPANGINGRQVNTSNFGDNTGVLVGLSRSMVSGAAVNAAAQGQWAVVDRGRQVDNDWSDPFVILQVRQAVSPFRAARVSN